jgi:hypothetical protein
MKLNLDLIINKYNQADFDRYYKCLKHKLQFSFIDSDPYVKRVCETICPQCGVIKRITHTRENLDSMFVCYVHRIWRGHAEQLRG